jgi:hypothetical protein
MSPAAVGPDRPSPWPTITLTLDPNGRLRLHQDTGAGVQVHLNPPNGPGFGMVVPSGVLTDVAHLEVSEAATTMPAITMEPPWPLANPGRISTDSTDQSEG